MKISKLKIETIILLVRVGTRGSDGVQASVKVTEISCLAYGEYRRQIPITTTCPLLGQAQYLQ